MLRIPSLVVHVLWSDSRCLVLSSSTAVEEASVQHLLLVVVHCWEGSGKGAAVWMAQVEKPLSQQGFVMVPE